jgi:hypothetical protein
MIKFLTKYKEDGSSTDPCDEAYCGSKPFSEVEVKGVSDFILKNKDQIICYINFHSFSQLWMSPWGIRVFFIYILYIYLLHFLGYTNNIPKDYKLQV